MLYFNSFYARRKSISPLLAVSCTKFSFNNLFKLCTLLMILIFSGFGGGVSAQGGGHICGVYIKPKPETPPSAPYMYSDRFGNKYTAEELTLAGMNIQAGVCPPNEDFELIFEINQGLSFTTPEQQTICEVFAYLSSIIVAPSGERAIIRLRKSPTMPISFGAVGTVYFLEECGMGHSLVHQQLFTGGANAPQHGLIEFNANLNNFYIGPENNIGSNQIDFYTVVLHEALHVLGFASRIKPDGSPDGFTRYGTSI